MIRHRLSAVVIAGVLSAALAGALGASPASAVEPGSRPTVAVTSPERDTALATRLVNRFFTALQRQDTAALRRLLSPAFQVARADGSTSTKAAYLANPPRVEKYAIDDMLVTREGGSLVARYSVVTSETVNGQELARDPALRLSVFVRDGGAWRLLAHSNFNVPLTTS